MLISSWVRGRITHYRVLGACHALTSRFLNSDPHGYYNNLHDYTAGSLLVVYGLSKINQPLSSGNSYRAWTLLPAHPAMSSSDVIVQRHRGPIEFGRNSKEFECPLSIAPHTYSYSLRVELNALRHKRNRSTFNGTFGPHALAVGAPGTGSGFCLDPTCAVQSSTASSPLPLSQRLPYWGRTPASLGPLETPNNY